MNLELSGRASSGDATHPGLESWVLHNKILLSFAGATSVRGPFRDQKPVCFLLMKYSGMSSLPIIFFYICRKCSTFLKILFKNVIQKWSNIILFLKISSKNIIVQLEFGSIFKHKLFLHKNGIINFYPDCLVWDAWQHANANAMVAHDQDRS